MQDMAVAVRLLMVQRQGMALSNKVSSMTLLCNPLNKGAMEVNNRDQEGLTSNNNMTRDKAMGNSINSSRNKARHNNISNSRNKVMDSNHATRKDCKDSFLTAFCKDFTILIFHLLAYAFGSLDPKQERAVSL